MKNKTVTLVKVGLLLPALSVIVNSAVAQKIPSVQKVSVYAPANLKIDGKATEWDNKLQAYNNATDIGYTLSNDDKALYLTVQSKYHDVVDKILRGGITLVINHTASKRDEKRISITYPVIRDADMSAVTNLFASKTNDKRDTKSAEIKIDDLNALLQAKDKTINVTGIESISEPSISIYNTEGIKTASLFDGNLTYTCELAIPLKYLALPNDGADAFSYQIKVNEPAANAQQPVHKANGSPPPPPPPMMTSSLSTTDFWGEYTLARKP